MNVIPLLASSLGRLDEVPNQELAQQIIGSNNANRKLFTKTLTSRLPEIEKDTKRIRVKKVIKKVTQ